MKETRDYLKSPTGYEKEPNRTIEMKSILNKIRHSIDKHGENVSDENNYPK